VQDSFSRALGLRRPTGGKSREVVSRGRPALALFGLAGFAFLTGFGLHDVIRNPSSDLTPNVLGYALLCTAFLASITTRIETESDCLRIVNLLTVTTVYASAIASVDGQNGLHIATHDQHEIGFLGYGESLAGNFSPNKGARVLARTLTAWRDAQTAMQSHDHEVPKLQTGPRYGVLVMGATFITIFAVVGWLAH